MTTTKVPTNAEIRESGQFLVSELQKAKVPSAVYARPPVSKLTFIAGLRRGNPSIIRFWPGYANIVIDTHRKYRQAVVSVTETRRKIQRKIWITHDDPGHLLQVANDTAAARFPIVLPRNATYTVDRVDPIVQKRSASEIDKSYWHQGDYKISYTVTATVPGSTQTLLMGFDEKDLFISMLPKRASTVEQAHEILKPKEIEEGTIRQGEFFFKPVSEYTQKQIEKYINNNPKSLRLGGLGWQGDEHGRKPMRLGNSRDHYALINVQYKNKQYIRGYVIGPVSRHDPIFLDNWHKVVRNREIQPPRERQQTYWD